MLFFLKLLLRTLCTHYVVNCELEAGGLLSALRQSTTSHYSQTILRLRITCYDCDLCCVKSHNLSTLHKLIQQMTALADTLKVSVEISVTNGSYPLETIFLNQVVMPFFDVYVCVLISFMFQIDSICKIRERNSLKCSMQYLYLI